MINNYLIIGFVTVIVFNIISLVLYKDNILSSKLNYTSEQRPNKILVAVVHFFLFVGIAFIFCGFALQLGFVDHPREAFTLLWDSIWNIQTIFLALVLLIVFYFRQKRKI